MADSPPNPPHKYATTVENEHEDIAPILEEEHREAEDTAADEQSELRASTRSAISESGDHESDPSPSSHLANASREVKKESNKTNCRASDMDARVEAWRRCSEKRDYYLRLEKLEHKSPRSIGTTKKSPLPLEARNRLRGRIVPVSDSDSDSSNGISSENSSSESEDDRPSPPPKKNKPKTSKDSLRRARHVEVESYDEGSDSEIPAAFSTTAQPAQDTSSATQRGDDDMFASREENHVDAEHLRRLREIGDTFEHVRGIDRSPWISAKFKAHLRNDCGRNLFRKDRRPNNHRRRMSNLESQLRDMKAKSEADKTRLKNRETRVGELEAENLKLKEERKSGLGTKTGPVSDTEDTESEAKPKKSKKKKSKKLSKKKTVKPVSDGEDTESEAKPKKAKKQSKKAKKQIKKKTKESSSEHSSDESESEEKPKKRKKAVSEAEDSDSSAVNALIARLSLQHEIEDSADSDSSAVNALIARFRQQHEVEDSSDDWEVEPKKSKKKKSKKVSGPGSEESEDQKKPKKKRKDRSRG
ncbi:hypothetical protein LTR10_011404 [Elasticomyces elasticus]|nr:hypothetical protein LTR10_011404 [Elasticomyces elasticus]KAK4966185.1 hypothetical protein LTR42_011346 [Elasticomyces elasticus]